MNITKMTLTWLALFFTALACAEQPTQVTGLHMPESVIQAKDGRILVSEIGEFGKDGDGAISIIDSQGKLMPFAKGMDDPKGLAMVGDTLFVADKTRILKVDAQGEWTVFVNAEAFPKTPEFLNDLESDVMGNLYVSDSGDLKGGGGAIYKINPQGQVSLVINTQMDARVLTPNGLLIEDQGKQLIWVDFTSGILYQLNMQDNTMLAIAEGFGGGDGIVRHAGILYVSDWKNGKVFSVQTGHVTLLRGDFKAAADITLTQDGNYLLVPDMKAGEVVYLPLH